MNEGIQKLRSITLTSGKIKDLAADCELLKIRGSVALHQEVRLKKISAHGHSSFHSRVVAQVLNNTGSCNINDLCEINEITNAGNLKIRNGQVTKINSSGKLTIEQKLQTEHFNAIGFVKAQEIYAVHFQLKMSGRSEIAQLIADEICVEKDRVSLSFLKKKLVCKRIKGRTLELSNTVAEVVEGDVVLIGDNCTIQTLYYKEYYTVSPSAQVQHIIRSEAE
ncbi:hypothetical protein ACQKII_15010 [Lysinibacillus sp. NPDC048646]|uniref:hypothetical protein n=1 Tax=Lysinibacillus sp. NPDC048646 TaxID=3390574 RepID=UPI003D08F21E